MVELTFSTLPFTHVPECVSPKVETLTVEAFMGSLNSTETVEFIATEVIPSDGLTMTTEGGILSVRITPVEKDE